MSRLADISGTLFAAIKQWCDSFSEGVGRRTNGYQAIKQSSNQAMAWAVARIRNSVRPRIHPWVACYRSAWILFRASVVGCRSGGNAWLVEKRKTIANHDLLISPRYTA